MPHTCHPCPHAGSTHPPSAATRLLWAQHGSWQAALGSCLSRQGASQQLSRLCWAASHLPGTGSSALAAVWSPARRSCGKHGSFPVGSPWQGLRFMPPMLQLPGRRPRQRSLLCAHSTVPKHLPAHIHVMLMEWSWDRTGRTWGTGRHSPTRMRTQTSSAMRAPGLSVADTT